MIKCKCACCPCEHFIWTSLCCFETGKEKVLQSCFHRLCSDYCVNLYVCWIIFTKHVTFEHDNKQSLLLLNSRYSCCFLLSIEMVNCLWIGVGNICCYYYFFEGSDHTMNISLSENISLKKTVKLIHAMTFYLRAIWRSFTISFLDFPHKLKSFSKKCFLPTETLLNTLLV